MATHDSPPVPEGIDETSSTGLRHLSTTAIAEQAYQRPAVCELHRRQLQRVNGKLIYTTPKTKRSRRAVPLPKACVKVLRDHKEAQEKQRANAEVWSDDDLVFTTSIGTPIEPRNLSRHFEALRKRAGLEHVRFHDLRHSCASLLFDLDVPLRMVMEILGHAQIATTADLYTHVMPAPYAEVADALDAWFGDDGEESETL